MVLVVNLLAAVDALVDEEVSDSDDEDEYSDDYSDYSDDFEDDDD